MGELLTIRKAALELRITSKAVHAWVDSGRLIATKRARGWRISRQAMETFVKSGALDESKVE